MFFTFGLKNKTVKELRKNRGYTVNEMAATLKMNPSLIQRVDDIKLKDIPDPLRSKLLPFLRGDDIDKAPW
jgi:hypothetical protein